MLQYASRKKEIIMYCKNCGKEIGEEAKFCPNCGTSQNMEQQPFTATEASYEVVEDKPAKCWTVFSIVGKVLGIVCLSTSVIPYINIFSFCFAIAGIVMSCLGRRAQTEATDKNCSLGLKLSIAAVVVSFVMLIVYIIAFGGVLFGIYEGLFEDIVYGVY